MWHIPGFIHLSKVFLSNIAFPQCIVCNCIIQLQICSLTFRLHECWYPLSHIHMTIPNLTDLEFQISILCQKFESLEIWISWKKSLLKKLYVHNTTLKLCFSLSSHYFIMLSDQCPSQCRSVCQFYDRKLSNAMCSTSLC